MEQVNPAVRSQMPPEYPVAQPPKFNFWLVSTLVLFIALVGVLGYFLGVSRNQNNQRPISVVSQTSTNIPLPISKQSESSPSPSTALPALEIPPDWKTYTLKDGKSSLRCPNDWKLIDNSKNVDLYNDGKVQFQQDITVVNKGYSLRSYDPLAWGPGACYFTDSTTSMNERVYGDKYVYDYYKEIIGQQNIYRRVKSRSQPKAGFILWSICGKERNSDTFVTVSGFGGSGYETPVNYDEKILNIMDQIISTIKVTN